MTKTRSAIPVLLLILSFSISLPGWAAESTAATQAIIRYDSIHTPVNGRYGMVVTQNEIASQVGQQILARGGNAVDAAVAIGFALAVTLPRAGNIGGSGFMLVYDADSDSTVALDFRSAAPASARLDDFRDESGRILWDDLTFGARAAAIPGTVAGLHHAWQGYGSLPWAELLQPAIDLASDGIVVTADLAYALGQALPVMSQYPSSVAAYAKAGATPYSSGELLRQPDLAWSLQEIASGGAAAFYRGAVADRIVAAVAAAGGYFTAQDLAAYRVRERQALAVDYRDHRVVTMPPSSVGGLAMLQMLKVLDRFPLGQFQQGSARSLHLIAETMKRVNANRRYGIGDTDFVDVPIAGILSDAIAQDIANGIDPRAARPVTDITPMDGNPYQSRETTHYSVVDRDGNAVSTTYTLGYSFGSGYVAEGTGILLDNQMRNFSHREPGHANAMAPGKRMVSTMTPTLVFDEHGELFLVTGTPGGSRIHNVILQLIINTVDYGLNIAEATHRPRIYQGWRVPELGVEAGVAADALDLLAAMGHEIERQQTMGSTQSIMLRDGMFYGAADPRRPGALALGLNVPPQNE